MSASICVDAPKKRLTDLSSPATTSLAYSNPTPINTHHAGPYNESQPLLSCRASHPCSPAGLPPAQWSACITDPSEMALSVSCVFYSSSMHPACASNLASSSLPDLSASSFVALKYHLICAGHERLHGLPPPGRVPMSHPRSVVSCISSGAGSPVPLIGYSCSCPCARTPRAQYASTAAKWTRKDVNLARRSADVP